MKTICFKFKCDSKTESVLKKDSVVCSSVIRYSYNRLIENKDTGTIYKDVTKKFTLISSHIKMSCIRYARKFVFKDGSHKNRHFGKFKDYVNGKINKEEYKNSRIIGIVSEGSKNDLGNCNFEIDGLNNRFIYKRSMYDRYYLNIDEKLKKKRKKTLLVLQLMMLNKEIPVSVIVKDNVVHLTFDESLFYCKCKFTDLKNNRLIGVDLNPNYYGVSVIEFDNNDNYKVLYKECIDVSNLLKCDNQNKINFELQQIDNYIVKLCNVYKASKIVVEDLDNLVGKKYYFKCLNKLNNNCFKHCRIRRHIKTLCNTYGVQFEQVFPQYSSICGNFIHGDVNCPDMIASSIEIARRGYKRFEKNWFYPEFINKQRLQFVLGNQWKEELENNCNSWIELAGIIKKSKLKYRFQLNPLNAVFRSNNVKKIVTHYIF